MAHGASSDVRCSAVNGGQMANNSDFYTDDGQPIMCQHCKSTKIKEITKGVIDVFEGYGPPCEIEYVCCDCNKVIGYWAYGYFDPSFIID